MDTFHLEKIDEWNKKVMQLNNEFKGSYKYCKPNCDVRYTNTECLCQIGWDSHSGATMYNKAYNYRDLQNRSHKLKQIIYFGENEQYQCTRDDSKIFGIGRYYIDPNSTMFFYDFNQPLKIAIVHTNY